MRHNAETLQTPTGTVELGTVEFEGREYSALGSAVTPDYLICYPNDRGEVCTWNGEVLGTYRVISSRPAVFFGLRSWQGSRYYFMRATVNGRTYALRGFGVGMIARGKAVRP